VWLYFLHRESIAYLLACLRENIINVENLKSRKKKREKDHSGFPV
jgi:hypothetical protein